MRLPGGYVGVGPMLVATNKAVWRLEHVDAFSLSKPTLVSLVGTVYPRTIAEYAGSVTMLDSEKQVRRIAGGLEGQPISLYKIEDRFISNIVSGASAIAGFERYQIAYKRQGDAVNRNLMQFDGLIGEWFEDSYPNQDLAGLGILDDGVQRRTLGFSDAGLVYWMEKTGQTTDDGSTINVSLATGELHEAMWAPLIYGTMGVVCDSVSGGRLTTGRAFPQSSGAANGSILIDVPSSRVWREDVDASTGIRVGGEGVSCQLSLSGAVGGGWNLHSWIVETEPVQGGADVEQL